MTQKDYAIDTFELAQWNVLRAIMRLKPKDLEYQITPNINPIRWILGHLTWHMDHIFNRQCRGTSQLTKEEREYFTSGAQGVVEREFPFSLMHLIETFLDVSESSFQYLRELPDEKLNEPPAKSETKDAETIYELLQRVSLHFLGHTGQIYLIKKELGKGGYFV
ncbi:MAG: DinB family protein, partial [Candidatus Thorarchaeota archaeon]